MQGSVILLLAGILSSARSGTVYKSMAFSARSYLSADLFHQPSSRTEQTLSYSVTTLLMLSTSIKKAEILFLIILASLLMTSTTQL